MNADLRAALLLGVVVVHGFAAAPLARHANRKALDLPLAQDELGRLQSVLVAVGFHPSIEDIADQAFAVSSAEAEVRRAVLAPFTGVFRITGTGQAWGLFTYPDRFPARLIVESRPAGGPWTTIYAALDPRAEFDRDKLVYRRIRGVYDDNSDRTGVTWDPFVSWVAKEVFRADPKADAVRVRFQRIHTYEPGERGDVVIEEGSMRAARTRKRP